MDFRMIFGAIVLLLFTAFFVMQIIKESREKGKVSKWNIFFLVFAVVLWLSWVLTFWVMAM